VCQLLAYDMEKLARKFASVKLNMPSENLIAMNHITLYELVHKYYQYFIWVSQKNGVK
jgi:hypothetical protein